MHRNIFAFRAAGSILVALLLVPVGFVGTAVAGPSRRSGSGHSLRRSLGTNRQIRRPRKAIVGGAPAPAGGFPWMALVVHNGTPSFACSGTVISANVVLTAGHCVIDETTGTAYSPSGYQVITGTVDRSDSSAAQVAGVSRTIPYPGFNRSTIDGDAALLVLDTPTNVPAIRLAASADTGLIQPGAGAVITGWGVTQYGAGELPTSLQWGTTVVQSAAYCQQSAGSYDDSKLCALDSPSFSASTCFGDSGGPLIALDNTGAPVEIGITSSGPADCSTTAPDLFTRVDPLSSWAAGWIAAVAPVTQPPPTTTPTPSGSRLPRMTRRSAVSYIHQTLAGVFGRKFIRGRQSPANCSRISAASFRCAAGWSYGPNDYSGGVTVLYRLVGAKVEWSSIYRVSTVNASCHSRSGSGKLCKPHITQGSW